MQGSRRPLRVRDSAQNLTDAGDLVLLRKLFDRFGLAGWIDGRANREKGSYRPGLWLVFADSTTSRPGPRVST